MILLSVRRITGTTHTSSSSLLPPAFPDHPSSVKSVSGESDADDEHEDMLDGLDFEGSVFETQSTTSAASAPGIKAQLEASLTSSVLVNRLPLTVLQTRTPESPQGL